MAKAKLTIKTDQLQRLNNAAEFSDVVVIGSKSLGELAKVEISYRQSSQIFELGRYFDKVTDAKPADLSPASIKVANKK